MKDYWFLYEKSTGVIYGTPYLGYVEEWTNIPKGCGVIGPVSYSDIQATEAFKHPNYYTVLNEQLTPVSNIEELRAADREPKPIPPDPVEVRMNEMQANFDAAIMEITMAMAAQQGGV